MILLPSNTCTLLTALIFHSNTPHDNVRTNSMTVTSLMTFHPALIKKTLLQPLYTNSLRLPIVPKGQPEIHFHLFGFSIYIIGHPNKYKLPMLRIIS